MSKEMSKDVSYVANEIPFIFRTSNLTQSRSYAIWFGSKIPPKRKFNSRTSVKQFDSELPNELSLSNCKHQLTEIEALYTETLKSQDKEWEEVIKRK